MPRFSLTNMVLDNRIEPRDLVRRGKPKWLRMQLPSDPAFFELRKLVEDKQLHTVCQEASCPNMGECWSAGVATLMILGDVCTRSCGFCHIKTGRPDPVDVDEPRRVGQAVAWMDLDYVVITSVDRDDLPDGGAEIWAQTIAAVRAQAPRTEIEVLVPDFGGDWDALDRVLDARPDVLAHNLETVGRLHKAVRPQAKYKRSLEVLRRARQAGLVAKTGIMVGIGERDDEVTELMEDLVAATRNNSGACEILTIGQYLQPSPQHLPVQRFVEPERFDEYAACGRAMGIAHVEAGPMVRSSYRADRQAKAAKQAQ